MNLKNYFFALCAAACFCSTAFAQSLTETSYDIGSPTTTNVWVDPTNGNDANSGNARSSALRTVNEAWNRIPQGSALTGTGYRIYLTSGTYATADLPNYWENRVGTAQFPIIFEAADGRGTAIFRNGPNVFNAHYLYFINVDFIPIPAGDAFHCEQCDHILLRGMNISGGDNHEAQETIKVNQSTNFYIEDSNIHGAYDNAIDFVAVQYGHIVRSLVHDAQDWCGYVKGGSAYIRVEGNRFYNCGTGGFTTGQGTGFEFMSTPWLHYEAYNIKVINNVVHNTEGAGLGVNGGYNILLAYNTLYRVGTRSHMLEVVFGLRGCDGNTSACAARVAAGGWGPSITGIEEPIPNRNVYIFNNILYNPAGVTSGSQHFAIYGPRTPSGGTNIPSPAVTDTNLRIQGNIIWNGPSNYPLGIEDTDQGCQPGNSTCNDTQLRAENSINTIEPALINPASGDFRPTASGNLFSATVFPLTDFTGGDLPASPAVAQGTLENTVSRDRSGAARSATVPPGAYATADASLDEPSDPGSGAPTDAAPTVSSVSCTPRSIKAGKKLTCAVQATDDNGISQVRVKLANKYTITLSLSSGRYRGTWKVKKLKKSSISVVATVTDTANQTTSKTGKAIKYKK